MDTCLNWSVGNAAYTRISRYPPSETWAVVQGAWNEQHCYPVAKDFAEFPGRSWYMGDIPHGWACAELLTLLRDILFYEADEDGNPHIYLARGIMPHWLKNDERVVVTDAPILFGSGFGYHLTHREISKRVEYATD
jgi:hypothetical protein